MVGGFVREDWLEWLRKQSKDVAAVVQETERDDVGITYAVLVSLRSLAASAAHKQGDRKLIWSHRVHFGQTDATVAGGAAFIDAARYQDNLASGIAAEARGWHRSVVPPLRKVVAFFEGVVRRRCRDGSSYEAAGYSETLECGHTFVPYDNHHLGGQNEPQPVGAKRRCQECAKAGST